MSNNSYHRDRIANRRLHPETLMMGYGYAPGLSEGSLKPPIFLTSTFVFENAQQGKDFFDLTSGRRRPRPGEKAGDKLKYSNAEGGDHREQGRGALLCVRRACLFGGHRFAHRASILHAARHMAKRAG